MDFSRVSYEQINSMASSLLTSAGTMQDILTEITNLFNNVGDESTWSGTSASATKEKFDTLSARFHEFYDAVESSSKYLNQMVENYKSVDSVVTGQ